MYDSDRQISMDEQIAAYHRAAARHEKSARMAALLAKALAFAGGALLLFAAVLIGVILASLR
jgi:hypothetical protein